MPISVRKARGGGFNIVEKATGRVKGHSATRTNAQRSANARNAGRHGWKATGKRARR